MCSSLFLTLYTIGVAFGAGLTVVALATPAWRKMTNEKGQNYYGIFNSCANSDLSKNECFSEFQNAPDWKKWAMACLAASLVCCAMAFVWSCVACFMCCCKSCLTPPLPLMAGLACAFDVAGVTIYGVKSGRDIGPAPSSWRDLESKGDFGYSMWVGIGAIIVLFIDAILGSVLVKTSKISPL